MNKQEKFLKLYEPVKKNLECFALSITSNYEDAKDLVSETILNAYIGFENIKDEKAFVSFLFTIARRINYRLINEKKYKYIKADSTELDFLISNETSPEDLLDIKFLHQAIEKLNINEKEALILAEVNGFKMKEIAVIQNTSIFNVKIRIHRAKKKLKQILTETEIINVESEFYEK